MNIDYALRYAELGIPVLPLHWIMPDGICSCGGFIVNYKTGNNIPCKPGKHPHNSNGVSGATTDKKLINEWWDKWPQANIGAACGYLFDVIDVDPRNGGLESINGDQDALDKLLTQHTGQGGNHYLVKPGSNLICRTGIDMIKKGKYIVAEPSLTHQNYYFDDWDVLTEPFPELLPAPKNFVTELVKPNNKKSIEKTTLSISDQKLLINALDQFDSSDYDLWIKFGQCLVGLGSVGRGMFFNWSRQSVKYDDAECAKKWDSFKGDYAGYKGILKAAYDTGWSGLKKDKASNDLEGFQAQEWKENLANEIDYIIPFPGIARDIQQWILDSSMYPQPAISFAATMSVLSVCIGRNIAYENIKGNLMFICMAESGEGKDYPFKAAKKLLDAVGLGGSVFSRMASGAALMEAMRDSPSMLFHVDEFGNYLSSINGKNANQYSKEIVDIMTLAYTDADGSISGKKTKGNDAINVIEPNMCVFGLSTERQLFDGLRTSDLANGSLARYSLLFGLNGLLPRDITQKPIPSKITQDLLELIKTHEKSIFIASTQLKVFEEYRKEKFALVKRTKEHCILLTGTKEAFKPVYNRIAFRSVQQAMLVDQCKDISVLSWFEALELKSFDVFMKKFLHLGSDNETEKHFKDVENSIKKAGTNGISQKDLLAKTRHVETGHRNRMIAELISCGAIFIKEAKTGRPGPVPRLYFWSK